MEWKADPERRPFFLTGRKGVGKTYLACDFAKSFFEDYIYINFETNPGMDSILFSNPNIPLIEAIRRYFELPEGLLSSVPVVFDEISYSPGLLAEISRNFDFQNVLFLMLTSYENDLPDSVKKACSASETVLGGMDFDEFLIATSNDWYIDVIRGHYEAGKKIPEIVHNELLTLFEDYLTVGGMPGAVSEFVTMESANNVAEQHRILSDSYYTEIGKRNQESDALKIHQVYDTIAAQLLKENRKFQYRLIRKGATRTLYGGAIEYLTRNGYVLRCCRENDPGQFKLYLPDVGMLHTMLLPKIPEQPVKELIDSVKKILLENYVLASLTENGYQPFYWESDSLAKIDFIITKNGEPIPIEVRSGENTRTKSIGVYRQHCDYPYSYKISAKNFEITPDTRFIPYYAVFCL